MTRLTELNALFEDLLVPAAPPDSLLEPILQRSLDGYPPSAGEARRLMCCSRKHLGLLCRTASLLREERKGRRVSFSPKVFIPLTKLCRDFCSYCTFREAPQPGRRVYMAPEEVLEVARAGDRLGCTEALFTLGERPEQRYPEARAWLVNRGYSSTIEYLRDMCELVLTETALLPHANPGTMTLREIASLREVNASMGLMLESTSERLCGPGGPHEFAPSKRPAARLKTIDLAGELQVPFTTGLLIGIGETPEERADALFAIRDLHERHGHIQEVIIQNFRAKPDTPMAHHPEPTVEDILRTVAVARIVLGPGANIQVPPNLSAHHYPIFLRAGINDWGGISPLTIDYVNPEAPWPHLGALRARTEEMGFELRPRLPVYPEYVHEKPNFLSVSVRHRLAFAADEEGYVRGGMGRYVPDGA
ncbi:MAG: 7,8-didemethyl-8-hydroxy-5-deazariboflavin synthase CofG [bacterium]